MSHSLSKAMVSFRTMVLVLTCPLVLMRKVLFRVDVLRRVVMQEHTHTAGKTNNYSNYIQCPPEEPTEQWSDGELAVKDFRPLASLMPAKGGGRWETWGALTLQA